MFHLAKLVGTLMAVKSGRMDEYVAAVRSDICTTCTEQDAEGHCRLRLKGDCALTAYMPLVLEAIEEVDPAWRGRQPRLSVSLIPLRPLR